MIVDSLIQELKLCIFKGVEVRERAPLIYRELVDDYFVQFHL